MKTVGQAFQTAAVLLAAGLLALSTSTCAARAFAASPECGKAVSGEPPFQPNSSAPRTTDDRFSSSVDQHVCGKVSRGLLPNAGKLFPESGLSAELQRATYDRRSFFVVCRPARV